MDDTKLTNSADAVWSYENKALAFLLITACFSKFLFFADISFWLDEQISIAIAMEGPLGCVPATLRFSAHPPAYYCQLSIWTLLDNSDVWIMANSIGLNILAVALVYKVTRRRYGLNIGLFASLTLALLPQFNYYAANARMYSWIIVFSVLCWHLTECLFADREQSLTNDIDRTLKWRMLCMLLLGYAHAIGPIYVVIQAVYAFWLALEKQNKRTFKKWFGYEALTGILLIPVAINGAFRETQHQNTESSAELATVFAKNFASNILPADAYIWALCLLVTSILVATLVVYQSDKLAFKRALVLICGQILLFVVVSLTLKPILSSRGLVTILPAVCLLVAVAQAKLNISHRIKPFFLLGWFGLLSFGSYHVFFHYNKPNDYVGAVANLTERIDVGDELYIYAGATHWGFARAMNGPDWGSPLDIQAPPNERWQKVEDALGDYCDVIMMCAQKNYYDWQQNRVYVFHDQMDISPQSDRIWLIHNAGQDIEYIEAQLRGSGYVVQYEENHEAELIRLFKQRAS